MADQSPETPPSGPSPDAQSIRIEGQGQQASNAELQTTLTRVKTHNIGDVEYHDPLELGPSRRPNVSQRQLKMEHPKANKKKLKKFYTQQNDLIEKFLQSGDEERMAHLDMQKNGPKIKFAIHASTFVNLCLFVIQMYAAISTGSLSLFATAADAFVCKWHLLLESQHTYRELSDGPCVLDYHAGNLANGSSPQHL